MHTPETPWSWEHWHQLDAMTRQQALQVATEQRAWACLVKQARHVLRSYSTSFFIVTRFLPPAKRAQVEAIYAAVRYPDEIVDSFALPTADRAQLLSDWAAQYETALMVDSVQARLQRGVPCFLASFAQVVQDAGIPHEHYRAFLAAMQHDLAPGTFHTLEELIESYIYGSAIVVGYFLAYVYGPATGDQTGQEFQRALQASRELGIALQLTNFLRDVAEDQRRGRLYLPLQMLQAEGVFAPDANDPQQQPAFQQVLSQLTQISEEYYAAAAANLDAFAPDCRTAIHACIDVYRQLNRQINQSPRGLLHRESVPLHRKFQVLPVSKYWRLPLAYLAT